MIHQPIYLVLLLLEDCILETREHQEVEHDKNGSLSSQLVRANQMVAVQSTVSNLSMTLYEAIGTDYCSLNGHMVKLLTQHTCCCIVRIRVGGGGKICNFASDFFDTGAIGFIVVNSWFQAQGFHP